jgi:GT2 family glycosyltransferase
MPDRIAAIVPTYNRQDKLNRFLTAFTQQTHLDLQIIVVDSNSTDGTQEFVRHNFPQVTLVEVSEHEYWTGATNAGIKLALEGNVDRILTINDDAVVDRDYVSRLSSLAQQHQLAILGSRIDYLSPPDRIWSLGSNCEWGTHRILNMTYHNADRSEIPTDVMSREYIEVDTLAGNGVLIDRSVFDRIGLYNDRYCPHYHADSEFILRARSRGISAYVATSIVVSNDYVMERKPIDLSGWSKLKYTFFHPKSAQMAAPLFYIIWQYCPNDLKISTLMAMVRRFQYLASQKRSLVN